MKKGKSWNVILFSNPKDRVKKLYITKTKIFIVFSFVLFTFFLIGGFVLKLFQDKQVIVYELNEELHQKINEIAIKNEEIEEVRKDYISLKEDAYSVQQTIDEIKSFEKKISNLELEIPGEENIELNGS